MGLQKSRHVFGYDFERKSRRLLSSARGDKKKSYSALVKALQDRCEGGLALLKYKREFYGCSRQDGETLHSYLSVLRLLYNKVNKPPNVESLPEDIKVY